MTICGIKGKACSTWDEYPVCDESQHINSQQVFMMKDPKLGWLPAIPEMFGAGQEASKLPMLRPDTFRAPVIMGEGENKIDEIKVLLESPLGQTWLTSMQKQGMCRSPFLPYKWFAFEKLVEPAVYLTFYNRKIEQSQDFLKFESAGFELTVPEMMALARCKELKFDRETLKIKEGSAPKIVGEDPDGNFKYDQSVKGTYLFTKMPDRLKSDEGTGIIDVLENDDVKIPGLSDERRKELIDHLEGIYKEANIQRDFISLSTVMSVVGGVSGLLVSVYFGKMVGEDIIKRIRGRVITTRFDQVIDKRLKMDPNYDVKGRGVEAKVAWEMASQRSGYINLIFDAPTGEGKDVIVEKMTIMKQKGDAAVPERFRNASVMKINAAEFQAGTMYRGNVADKVAEIAREARKGPVIFYISEIDLVFLSGGTTSGDTESPGKLILDLVDDPAIKHNLLLIGTTSRGKAMLERYPDLQRRFNWPKVRSFTLEEKIDVLDGPKARELEKLYDVKIFREMIDAAARMAEHYYRPTQYALVGTVPPQFSAITAVLEKAIQTANKAGYSALTFEHIAAATGELCAMSIDPTLQNELLTEPLEQVVAEAQATMASSSAIAGKPDRAVRAMDFGAQMLFGSASEILEKLRANPELRRMGFARTGGLPEHVQMEYAAAIDELLDNLPEDARREFVDPATKAFIPDALPRLVKLTAGMGMQSRRIDMVRQRAEARDTTKADDATDATRRGRTLPRPDGRRGGNGNGGPHGIK
ncbi:MAG: hypothetical protein ABH871_03775 [Pseudomonadota bacterium]